MKANMLVAFADGRLFESEPNSIRTAQITQSSTPVTYFILNLERFVQCNQFFWRDSATDRFAGKVFEDVIDLLLRIVVIHHLDEVFVLQESG